MFIPKRYGQSKVDKCPFCEKQATAINSQKIPVCALHKEDLLDDLKCACGSTLDLLHGKFGAFFSCMKCGNMNLRKVMEINIIKPKPKVGIQNINQEISFKKDAQSHVRKETTVRSDDPRYFD